MINTFIKFESLESRQLLSFGQPVQDFGVGGVATTTFTNSGNADAAEMLVDKGGRIVIASNAGLARLLKTGLPDTAFGTDGLTNLKGLQVKDAAFDSSGRIVVLATGASGTLLLRFTAGGKTDKTFGING